MATVTRGYSFGATELVTHTKLHTLVDSATVTSIVNADCSASMALADSKLDTISTASKVRGTAITNLASIPSGAGKIPPYNLYNLATCATNASLIDVSLYRTVKLHYGTYGSLATFINYIVGQPFTLIAGQASFPVIIDGGNFMLAGNWIPDGANDNLTLVWDGTNFIEISRVNT